MPPSVRSCGVVVPCVAVIALATSTLDVRTDPRPTEPADSPARLYGVLSAVPVELLTAARIDELDAALDRLITTMPEVSIVAVHFDEQRSTRDDWLAVLDACRRKRLKAVVGFATVSETEEIDFRPPRTDGTWQFGALGRFVMDWRCITHEALHAVWTVDEPWHKAKPPFYSTADLKDMYAALKSLAPDGVDFKILVQFSREIWKYIVDQPVKGLYWDRGLCDIVQISGLELQDREYSFDLLDSNHYWSRRLIHERTPEIPLWTSVQVMGTRYGPSAGYWFPRERNGHRDLLTLLTDLTAEKYEREHPLTGLMFQSWDSKREAARPQQYRLGDTDRVGRPVTQADAAGDAVLTIREWIRPRPAQSPGQ